MSTQFAMDHSNRIIHISEAERGLSCNCSCVVCGERMMAKKGEEREHHFAHESNKVACVANHETLLHKFAKRAIQEAGGLVVPPAMNYRLSALATVSQANLTWLTLDRIEEEKWLDNLRPDLIGYYRETPVLIEAAYSSFVDADKQAKLEARGLIALEIDVRDLPPENFDPDLAKEAIVHEAGRKEWLFCPEPKPAATEQMPSPSYIHESLKIKGIFVYIRELPFGDLAIKVSVFNPEVNAIVKGIAKRYFGRWKPDYKNWIVPKNWLHHAINDLRIVADQT
jgi:competence protein CoiA